MAKYNKRGGFNRGKKRGYTKRRFKKRDGGRSLTKLAYQLGQIERGRKNSDSRISAAFNRGSTPPAKRERKTLF